MEQGGTPDVTALLVAWTDGDRGALDRLMPLVYAELKRVARRHLARGGAHTLQATALVHEAYVKLIDQHSVTWQNRAHFFAIAARLMRRIVMQRARRAAAQKRGGAYHVLCVDDVQIPEAQRTFDLLVLEDVLARLAEFDPRQSQIVEWRFFGGLSIEEIAGLLDVSAGTVKREWRTARAWLHKEVAPGLRP